jgi:DNA-binding transcriptional MerR regulator
MTKKDIARLLGVRGRTVQFFVDSGLLVPDNPKPGKGKSLTFSPGAIFNLLLYLRLRETNCDTSLTKEIIANFSRLKRGDEALAFVDPVLAYVRYNKVGKRLSLTYEIDIEAIEKLLKLLKEKP